MKPIFVAATLLPATLLLAAPVLAATPAPPGRAVEENGDGYDFAYSYPAKAGAIPALKARLDADLAKQRRKIAAEARTGRAEARQGKFPFNPYSYTQSWDVVTDLPGWLSLSAAYGTYEGGAHGMSWSGAMLWDRKANLPRNPLDLFISKAALASAIRKPFCAALNQQRAEKRGEPVKAGSTDMFDECIDPTRETVILGSKGRKAFDRIGILIAPYSAGPYVEGDYEVTLPVTPAVLAAVKPQFKAAFAVLK